MLDDKDEFKKNSIWAEHIFSEARACMEIIQKADFDHSWTNPTSRTKWFSYVRGFIIKYHTEIDEAISWRITQ